MSPVLPTLFATCKTQERNDLKEKKDFFWLLISEVPVTKHPQGHCGGNIFNETKHPLHDGPGGREGWGTRGMEGETDLRD